MSRYIFTRERKKKKKKKCKEFLKTSPYAEDIKVMIFSLIPFAEVKQDNRTAAITFFFENEETGKDKYEDFKYGKKIEADLKAVVGEYFHDSISIHFGTVQALRSATWFDSDKEELSQAHFIKGKEFFFASTYWVL